MPSSFERAKARAHSFGYGPAANFYIVVWKHPGTSIHCSDCHSGMLVSVISQVKKPGTIPGAYLNPSVTQALRYGAFSKSVHEGVDACAS